MTTRLTFTATRHQYKLDGNRVPSVTTLLRVLDKPALPPWAARITARYAVDHWDDLAAMAAEDRFELIKGTADRARKTAAAKGTQIHAWAEALLAGHELDIPAEYVATVEGFAKFWDSAGLTVLHREAMVWAEGDVLTGASYAGTFDLLAEDSRGRVWLLDHKTGSGVYDDMALQLAGYADAEWIVVDDHDMPMPRVDRLGVLHIRPDGTNLHVVENPDSAAERWRLLRLWASVDRPSFRQES